MHVTVEKRADVLVCHWNLMLLQYTDHDSRISHPRDFDIVQVIGNTEALRECQFECVDACASRMDKRAIDVEKKKALVHFRFSIFYCRLEFVLRRGRTHAENLKSEIQNLN